MLSTNHIVLILLSPHWSPHLLQVAGMGSAASGSPIATGARAPSSFGLPSAAGAARKRPAERMMVGYGWCLLVVDGCERPVINYSK